MALKFLNDGYFAGKVGIGTESPQTGVKLDVRGNVRIGDGSSAEQDIHFNNSTTEWQVGTNNAGNGTDNNQFYFYEGGNYRLTVQKGGNVGIGTTSPEEKLKVIGSVLISNNEFYKVENTTGTNYKIAGLTNGNMIQIGAIDYTSAGTIFAGGDNVSITTGGASGSTRIKIASSGNVGIGTTSPSAKLEVTGNTRLGSGTFHVSSDATLITSSTYTFRDGVYINNPNSTSAAVASGNVMSIGASSGNTVFTSLITTGAIGIGKSNPSAQLDVVGTGNFTGLVSGITPVNAANFVTKAYVDGSSGGTGPFLPLAGGTMTGTNGIVLPDNFILNIGTSNDLTIKHNATDSFIENHTGHLSVVNYANDKDIILWGDDGTGGISKYLVLEGVSTNAYFSNPGNVGIGTTSPAEKLHVFGGAAAIEIDSTTNEASLKYDNSTTTANIKLANNDLKTELGGTEVMRILANGNVGIGTTSPGGKLEVDGTYGDLKIGDPSVGTQITYYDTTRILMNSTDIKFYTNSLTERMTIESNGNVGIGTTNPGRQLELRGQGVIRLNAISSGDPGLDFNTSDVNDMQIRYRSTTDALAIYSYGTSSDVLTIKKSDGNVGIGTTSPSYKLTVSGGGIQAGGKITYTKSAGSLDTTGYAVAGLTTSSNGQSAGFTFTCFGHTGGYQKIVYSCYNGGGTWVTKKVINEGTNQLDVVASANGTTITFTFKSISGTMSYTPRVTVEAVGTAINSTYA